MTHINTNVLVCGAGIAGLTAALAMHRFGYEVNVLERRSAAHYAGSAVVLWPNGTRILHRLGLLHELLSQGTALKSVQVHRLDGDLIGRTDLATFSARCGSPIVAIDRNSLRSLLLSALHDNAVHFDQEVNMIDVASSSGQVTVRTSRQSTYQADALMLAGGLHCQLRDRFITKAAIEHVGVTDWLGVAALPSCDDSESVYEFIGPGLRAGFIHLPDGRVYFRFTACDQLFAAPASAWDSLVSLFAGRCKALDQRLAALEQETVHVVREADMAPLPTWHLGATCLIGDAAHGMTPALGQGANQAIVDAWVAAACLAQCGSTDAAAAWSHFEAVRKPVTEAIVAASRTKTSLFLGGGNALLERWYDDMNRLNAPEALAQLYDICREHENESLEPFRELEAQTHD